MPSIPVSYGLPIKDSATNPALAPPTAFLTPHFVNLFNRLGVLLLKKPTMFRIAGLLAFTVLYVLPTRATSSIGVGDAIIAAVVAKNGVASPNKLVVKSATGLPVFLSGNPPLISTKEGKPNKP